MMAIWLTLGFIGGGLCGVLVMSLLVAAKGRPDADIPPRPREAASV